MITFQAAHYMAFFRRTLTNIDLLAEKPSVYKPLLEQACKEITESEWTRFNDDMIEDKNTWESVVEYCIEF